MHSRQRWKREPDISLSRPILSSYRLMLTGSSTPTILAAHSLMTRSTSSAMLAFTKAHSEREAHGIALVRGVGNNLGPRTGPVSYHRGVRRDLPPRIASDGFWLVSRSAKARACRGPARGPV